MLYITILHIVNTKLMELQTISLDIQSVPSTEKLIAAFIESLDVKPISRQTYRRTLKQFFAWLEEKGYDLSQLTRTHILEYKEDLLSSGRASLTAGSYINSVRQFYTWAEANKLYPNIARGVKLPKRKREYLKQALEPEQATQLLKHYEDKALRDYAIVNLLLRTGLRTIEVSRANLEDIIYKQGQMILKVQGKGRDSRDNWVILTDKAYRPLEKYLTTRKKLAGSSPLFVSESNNSKRERITTRTISKIAKDGLKAIGINHRDFTAHSFRHTAAINILRAGGTLEMVQFTLRHTNPATTQIYTSTLNDERRLKNSGEALIDSMY
jgi:integrase/recombinase XerD